MSIIFSILCFYFKKGKNASTLYNTAAKQYRQTVQIKHGKSTWEKY